MKKVFILIACATFTSAVTAAEICPTTASLQSGEAFKHDWIALNINSDSPASQGQIQQFEKTVTNFYLAEWSADYTYGYGRCYYYNNVETYIARKENAMPQPTTNAWMKNGNVYQCSSSIANCTFGK